jgi:transposase
MLCIGIDWSDQALDFHLRGPDGEVLAQGQVRPTLDGLAELFHALEAHAPPAQIGIAVETAHGAWVQPLLDRGYRLYPVNPKSVDRFRQALSVAGNKSDKIDARVLAMFLATFQRDLRPLRPDDPDIVALRIACEDRVRLVEERTAKLNELRAVLKAYYPAFLGLFGDLDTRIAIEFLQEFSTQNRMLALSPRRLKGWLKRHGYSCPQRIAEMMTVLTRPALPVAEHLQTAKASLIRFLADSLLALQNEIARREQDVTDQFQRMPEADWVSSLPGAGPTLAPALLACLGRDPQRFDSPADARAFMGTAPVTKASGSSRSVRFRRGCWKFARRTLQLFADGSRRQCVWAQTCYEQHRARGHGHHAALRALAHKWLKVILAMKRQACPYREDVFVHSQRRFLLKSAACASPTTEKIGVTLT